MGHEGHEGQRVAVGRRWARGASTQTMRWCPGPPLPSPARSPTHDRQRRGAWPIVGFNLGRLVGVGRLGCRELGGLDDEVLDEVLALRAACRGLCGWRPGSVPTPSQATSAHPSPRLLHLSRSYRGTMCVKTGHNKKHWAEVTCCYGWLFSHGLPALTSLLVDGWLLVDVGIWAGGLCGQGARADEKDMRMVGETGSLRRRAQMGWAPAQSQARTGVSGAVPQGAVFTLFLLGGSKGTTGPIILGSSACGPGKRGSGHSGVSLYPRKWGD